MASAMTESRASASTNLFFTLAAMFAVVNVGYLLVRCNLISAEQGHLKAMSLFAGKLAFPALIFKTFATANLGDVNYGVVAACIFGKFVGMMVVSIPCFWGYEANRNRGSRVQSTTLFSFFIAATNDIALGMPVLNALYGAQLSNLYIAANVLWTTILFIPACMVLFEIGKDMKEPQQKAPKARKARMLALIRDIALNPVILGTVLGILYKQVFGWTLLEGDKGLQLPRPFEDIMDWLTRPFGTLLLLLTGAPLRSTKVTLWPSLLVLVKVIGVSFISYLAAGQLVTGSSGTHQVETLRNFCFFYGAIPTSSTPLVFAEEYDPLSTERIASATLFGMVLSAPVMYVASILNDDQQMADILQQVFFHIDVTSITCGVILFLILLICFREWDWEDPTRFLLAAYGVVSFLYALLSFIHNPLVNQQPCLRHTMRVRTSLAIGVRWSQVASSLLVVSLLTLYVRKGHSPCQSPKEPWKARWLGLIATVLSSVFAFIPAEVLIFPDLPSDFCATSGAALLPTTFKSAVWGLCLLGVFAVLVAVGIKNRRAEDSLGNFRDECALRRLVRAVITWQVVGSFVSTVNTILKLLNTSILSGSFQLMLIIGAILDQGQSIFFLFLVVHNGSFMTHFMRILPESLLHFLCQTTSTNNFEGFAMVQPPSSDNNHLRNAEATHPKKEEGNIEHRLLNHVPSSMDLKRCAQRIQSSPALLESQVEGCT